MSQYDFDSFKQHLRGLMDSHFREYDAFETGMNRRDDAGYQMILAVAMTVAPEYEKILNKRVNRSPESDISDIEQLFTDSSLVEKTPKLTP